MRINQRLRRSIFFITALAVLAIAVGTFLIYYLFSNSNLKTDTNNALDRSSLIISQTIDELDILTEKAQFFSKSNYDLLSDLRKYRENETHTSEDFFYTEQEVRGILRTLIYRMEGVNTIGLVLADGQIVSYSNTQTDFRYGYDPRKDDWYQETRGMSGDLLMSKVDPQQMFLNQSEPVLLFSRDIYDFYTKEFLGMLVINCEPNLFAVTKNDFPQQVIHYSLTDHDSQEIFYESEPQQRAFSTTLSIPIENHQQKLLLTATIDRRDYVTMLGWILLASVMILFLVLLVILVVSKRFSNSFTYPIVKLSRLMKAEQQLQTSVGDSFQERTDEIGVLYREYFNMLNALSISAKAKVAYEQTLLKSELNVYKNQIDSHFLYNTLESINSMAEIYDIEEIAAMTVSLSKMFRYTANGFINEGLLEDELKNVEDYLTIQRIRFSKPLDFILVTQDEELLRASVPRIILQPLIENAIYHGLNRGGITGKIRLFLSAQKDSLLIRVYDDGVGMDEATLFLLQEELDAATTTVRNKTAHIGLVNIQARIKVQYGSEYGMTVHSRLGHGTLIEMRLPMLRKGEVQNV